eukprot:740644-Pyramimonas_sp.AAC.1
MRWAQKDQLAMTSASYIGLGLHISLLVGTTLENVYTSWCVLNGTVVSMEVNGGELILPVSHVCYPELLSADHSDRACGTELDELRISVTVGCCHSSECLSCHTRTMLSIRPQTCLLLLSYKGVAGCVTLLY